MGELTPDMCEDDFLLQRQAVVHLQGRQWAEALEKLQVVLKRNPFCAEAYGLRGCALRPLARYADALESLDLAIQMKPDCAQAHHNRGIVLRDLKRLEEALASHHNALKFS